MKALFRLLGTVAAVAVTGAAIVVLDKILNDKDPIHVEEVEFPEEAEKDPAEAAKAAEAYAEGEAKTEAPAQPETPATAASSVTPSEAPAEEAAQPAEPEPAPAAPADSEKPAFDPDAPNPNPVEAAPAVAPKDENGKFDPTKIADASDFGDWEEQGCKG